MITLGTLSFTFVTNLLKKSFGSIIINDGQVLYLESALPIAKRHQQLYIDIFLHENVSTKLIHCVVIKPWAPFMCILTITIIDISLDLNSRSTVLTSAIMVILILSPIILVIPFYIQMLIYLHLDTIECEMLISPCFPWALHSITKKEE